MYTYYILFAQSEKENSMKQPWKKIMLSAMSVILILWGIYFAFWGFGVFVDMGILPANNLLAWESGLYGAIMMGWGLTLFFVGRIAFERNDKELLRALYLGLLLWLLVEAYFSITLSVWFNVAVDITLIAMVSLVLLNRNKE
jgi:hypothetical protein